MTPQTFTDQTSRVVSRNAKWGRASGIPITSLARGVPAVELRKAQGMQPELWQCALSSWVSWQRELQCANLSSLRIQSGWHLGRGSGNYWSSHLLRALPASFCVCVISSIRQQHCAITSTRVFMTLDKFKELNSAWEWEGWVGWKAQQLSCLSSSQISFWERWESAAFFLRADKCSPEISLTKTTDWVFTLSFFLKSLWQRVPTSGSIELMRNKVLIVKKSPGACLKCSFYHQHIFHTDSPYF